MEQHPTIVWGLVSQFAVRLSRLCIRGWRVLRKIVRCFIIVLGGTPGSTQPVLSYGHWAMPGKDDIIRGGMVKFFSLNEMFPHSARRFNILYLSSSSLPEEWAESVRLARVKGAKIVLNQNGVGYPAWAKDFWRQINRPLKKLVHAADYVVYQSEFCKLSADRFLGNPRGRWTILYNPVDTDFFRPPERMRHDRGIVLLHVGTVMASYRFESAVQTLAELTRRGMDARLIFAGSFVWHPDARQVESQVTATLEQYKLRDRITMLPPYGRHEAPSIFHQGDILLHTKVNDPCPTVVLEAMACGVPVVYAASGGVPELVGSDAGIGVPDEATWDQDVPADYRLLADAVIDVWENRAQYRFRARCRAVEKFDLNLWLAGHKQIFHEVISQ